MAEPAVSYVVAAYNHEAYIQQLLQSLSAQTFADIEVIVVDDGSGDATADVAQTAAKEDPRISVWVRPHGGVVSARNFGIGKSSGQFLSVVDSDDVLPVHRTAVMVEALENDPAAALVYGEAQVERVKENVSFRFSQVYPPVDGSFSEALFCNYCFVPAASVMFRRKAFDATGAFWGPGPNSDYLKWIELGFQGKAIYLPNQVLGTWRLHGKNASQANAYERCAQYDALCHALVELTNKYPLFARSLGPQRIRQRCGRCYRMAGYYAAREREWRLAAEQFRRAKCYDPSILHALLCCSTLPFVNKMTGVAFDITGRILLREPGSAAGSGCAPAAVL